MQKFRAFTVWFENYRKGGSIKDHCEAAFNAGYDQGSEDKRYETSKEDSPMTKRLKQDKCDDCHMTGGYHHQDCKYVPANF